MRTINTQLLIIGAGPGGYVCAIRAAQLGINTLIVEAKKAGGTCLNVGCIPSKALIHAADEFHKLTAFCASDSASAQMGLQAAGAKVDLAQTMLWKDGIVNQLNGGVDALLMKAGVETIYGSARFLDGKSVQVETAEGLLKVHAENVVIATGSEPAELSSMPFTEHVLDSTAALALTEVPESLAVVGGGYIGLELGISYAKLGSRVSIVESAERILPQYDKQLTDVLAKRLSELGITVRTQSNALSYQAQSKTLCIRDSEQQENELVVDKVLVTVGRKARLAGYGLDELSLSMHNRSIAIDEHCQTSMRGVYAIGDVTGEPMLAHRAMAQAELVAQHLAGRAVVWDKQCIPAVCFTDPEIVSVGLTPQDAESQNRDVGVSSFPFKANGRALSMQSTDGFVRVVIDAQTHAVLGIQAVGSGVSELSTAFALAIEMGARAEDIAMTIHAHPTMGEAFQEACMSAIGQGLHL